MPVEYTDRVKKHLAKQAYVEIECGYDHSANNGYCPANNRKHHHDCHLCAGFRLMKASTPKDEQICDNCGGPVVATGDCCWPHLVMMDDFLTNPEAHIINVPSK